MGDLRSGYDKVIEKNVRAQVPKEEEESTTKGEGMEKTLLSFILLPQVICRMSWFSSVQQAYVEPLPCARH